MRIIAIVGSAVIALATGAGMKAEWPALALYWYAPAATSSSIRSSAAAHLLSVHGFPPGRC